MAGISITMSGAGAVMADVRPILLPGVLLTDITELRLLRHILHTDMLPADLFTEDLFTADLFTADQLPAGIRATGAADGDIAGALLPDRGLC